MAMTSQKAQPTLQSYIQRYFASLASTFSLLFPAGTASLPVNRLLSEAFVRHDK
jgi:hypothetical protein